MGTTHRNMTFVITHLRLCYIIKLERICDNTYEALLYHQTGKNSSHRPIPSFKVIYQYQTCITLGKSHTDVKFMIAFIRFKKISHWKELNSYTVTFVLLYTFMLGPFLHFSREKAYTNVINVKCEKFMRWIKIILPSYRAANYYTFMRNYTHLDPKILTTTTLVQNYTFQWQFETVLFLWK